MKPFVSLGLRSAAVLSVLAAAQFESLLLGLIPVVLIFLSAILVWRTNQQRPSNLYSLADQVYFLGYLSTLAALAGIVLMVRNGKGFDDPRKLLLMVAIALLATVTGLLAMMSLKDLASNAATDGTAAPWEEQVIGALKGHFTRGFEAGVHVEVSQDLIDASRKIATLIAGVNTELENLRTNMAALATRANEGTSGAQRFSEGVQELEQVLRDFVQLVRSLFPETQEEVERL